MELKQFKQALLDEALKAGFTDAEIYYSQGGATTIRVFKGEISHFENNESVGLSFRGTYNGKVGYSYSERIDESCIPAIIEDARQNAEIIEEDEQSPIFAGSDKYEVVVSVNDELDKVPVEQKINDALALEKSVLDFSPKIAASDYCTVTTGRSTVEIQNTLGLNVSHASNYAAAYVQAIAEQDGQKKTSFDEWCDNDYSKLNPVELGKSIAGDAVASLGAKSLSSGKYKIVFKNIVMSSIMDAFSSIFFADTAQKGFSLLVGKIGQIIASEIVSVRDDALLKNGYASSPFDAEGVATSDKLIIENGCFKTFLHNLKTSKKDNVESTGNANKSSYKAAVKVAASNFYIVPAQISFDTLIEKTGDGIYITDVSGLHSGVHSISGDFSVMASGYKIEGGKITSPVEQITCAGNFFELLKDIKELGNDLRFNTPSGFGAFGSPSLLIDSLSVSGS